MKSTLLLFLWVGCGLCWAQTLPADSTKTNKSAQDYQPIPSRLIPQITPKSPAAAALGRYGEYPVNMYTGLPTIEIPLFEFKVDKLIVPVKLTYHAGGNKVNDLASWVGMGWSLHTGGMITRTVLGTPDEQAALSGLLNKPVSVPSINYSCQTESEWLSLPYLVDNLVDTQRDLFTYQTPSGGNTFIVTSPPNGFSLLSPEPVKLGYDAELSSFSLIDATGTQFLFTDKESAGAPTGSTSWMLSRIIGANPSQGVFYTYQDVSNQSSPEPYDLITIQGEVMDNNNPKVITAGVVSQISNNDAGVSVTGKQPQEIVFPGGKIQFVLEPTQREEGGYGLDYVDIFGFNVSSSSYTRIKRYDFRYRNVYRKKNDGTNQNAVALLDEIRLVQSDGATVIGSYSFTYNETPLPEAASRRKDFWGYSNGQTGTSLIPQQNFTYQAFSLPGSTTTITIGNGNRDPNEALMQAWSLQSIRFPTGGSTRFTYEANRYAGPTSTTLLAGGLRVTTIKSYSATGQFAFAKRYRYGTNESGLGTPRFLVGTNELKPRTVIQDFVINLDQAPGTDSPYDYSYRVYAISSAPSGPLTPNEGSSVTYPQVTEYLDDANGNAIGKTVYAFSDNATDAIQSTSPGKFFVTSRNWERGQLLTRSVYNAQNQLKTQLINSYTAVPSGTSADKIGYLLSRDTKQQQIQVYFNTPCIQPPDLYRGPVSYPFVYGTMRLAQSVEYVYDDLIPNNYIIKTAQTDYSSLHYQPTERRTFVQNGQIVGTQYTYPQSFTAPSPFLPAWIQALKLQNIHEPLEIINFRKKPTESRKYLTGSLTSYTTITVNTVPGALTNQIAVPYQTYLSEAAANQTSYVSSAAWFNSQGNYQIDAAIWQQPRATMTGYDTYGNLTRFNLTAGLTTQYAYSNYAQGTATYLPVLTSETKNYGVPLPASAQVTSFGYTIPLLGVSSITDPRTVLTTYEYDAFGRLSRIRDKNGNILKQFIYRYATSTESVP